MPSSEPGAGVGPDGRGRRTLPTIWNWPPSTFTAYMSCIAWWSPARMVLVPCGVAHCRPRIASRTLSVSVLLAFSTAAL
jgi:hypothetical protein